MRFYGELASVFHRITPPEDYVDDAERVVRVVDAVATGPAATLLELGSGWGNNAFHLKRRFDCTLVDISDDMLDVSRSLNPECEHLVGDMRSVRLDREFDVVFVHDAIDYMRTQADLAAAIGTVAAHLRPGGVAVLTPDFTAESFRPGTLAEAKDHDDIKVRYLEWTHAPAPGSSEVEVDMVLVARDGEGRTRVEHDRHTVGVFPEATWTRLLEGAGLSPCDPAVPGPLASEMPRFVARRARPG
ncbi:MAG: class I SAM-dependent methyltransferase [Miltoncostaeaceae bacterium]